jgi:hypothetical protein
MRYEKKADPWQHKARTVERNLMAVERYEDIPVRPERIQPWWGH